MQETEPPPKTAAVFLDRDGTINHDPGYVSSPDQMVIYPWTFEAIRMINEAGLKAIVVTNQSGIARGFYSEEDLSAVHERMRSDLAERGARVDAVYYCPHHPEIAVLPYGGPCECRKPNPGMLLRASREHEIDLSRSYVIGDKACDMDLAENAGALGILVRTGYGTITLSHPDRFPCTPGLVAEDLLEAVQLILGGRIEKE